MSKKRKSTSTTAETQAGKKKRKGVGQSISSLDGDDGMSTILAMDTFRAFCKYLAWEQLSPSREFRTFLEIKVSDSTSFSSGSSEGKQQQLAKDLQYACNCMSEFYSGWKKRLVEASATCDRVSCAPPLNPPLWALRASLLFFFLF